MKKTLLLMLMLLSLAFTSCYSDFDRTFGTDNNAILYETMEELVAAINAKDSFSIVDLFSQDAQSSTNIKQDALELIELFEDGIVSFPKKEEFHVNTQGIKVEGRLEKNLEAYSWVNTAEKKYRFCIKECIINESAPEKVGITSIYIKEEGGTFPNGDKVYWEPGINIFYSSAIQGDSSKPL